MLNPPKKSIEFITNLQKLEECILFLEKQIEIAFDFEFDSNRYRYGYTLCLIQVCAANRCFLIDPFEFKPESLVPVFLIFENKQVLKIVHSGGEDLRILQRLGYKPKNLFDTQVAAQFLGHEKTSLGNVLQNVLDIELDKKQQDSNWVKRPLSPEQLKYAANDVLFLDELKTNLLAALKGEILEWFQAEMAQLDNVVFTDEKKDPIQKDDRRNFSLVELYILRGMLEFREAVAKNMNRPVYQIFKDDYARELVRDPSVVEDWPYNKQSLIALRNVDFQHKIQKEYQRLKQEASTQNLTQNTYFQQKNDGDWRTSQQKRQQDEGTYNAIFKPIKECLAQDYNTFIANNTLNRDTAMQLAGNQKKIKEILPNYKQQLILAAAAQLGLDLSVYL